MRLLWSFIFIGGVGVGFFILIYFFFKNLSFLIFLVFKQKGEDETLEGCHLTPRVWV